LGLYPGGRSAVDVGTFHGLDNQLAFGVASVFSGCSLPVFSTVTPLL
jgi:hypothetical protein